MLTVASAATPPAPAGTDGAPAVEFPQQRVVDGYALTLHAPQVRSWPGFERFTASVAFELTAPGASAPRFGTATVAGDTAVDLGTRIVKVTVPKVTEVKFADAAPPPIIVRSSPTLLLFVNGTPVHAPVPNTSLEVLVNANWPVFRDPAGPAWFLLERDYAARQRGTQQFQQRGGISRGAGMGRRR